MCRTSLNLNGLDEIIERLKRVGPGLSPTLFNPQFCDLMQRRIHFTAIRTFEDDSWKEHARTWQGSRYRLLNAITPLAGGHRKLQLMLAFLALRPFMDAVTIVWYRLLGSWVIQAKRRKQRQTA